MTAAATEGSTAESTSETLATLVRPGVEEPGDRGEQRGDDVQDDQDLPRAGARQARGHGVVADRVEQPAVSGASEADEDRRPPAARTRGDCSGGPRGRRRTPSQRSSGGTPAAGLDRLQLPEVGDAQDDQAHAQGHDQRVDAEDADADAGHQARRASRRRARRRWPAGVPGPETSGRDDEAGHRGDGADRQVDAAGEHRERLTAGEDRERDRGAEDDRPPTSGLTMPGPDRSLTITSDQHSEQPGSGMIGRSRKRPRHAAAPSQRLRALGCRHALMRAAPPDLDEAADHDDSDEDDALERRSRGSC